MKGWRGVYQSHFRAHIVFQIHFPLLKSSSYKQNSEKSHCYAYQLFSHHIAKLRPLNTTQQTKIPVIHACRKSVIQPLSVFIFLLLFSEPGWKHRSQCLFFQERYVTPLLFTVTQTYGKQTSLSTAWPRTGAVLALHVVCFLVLSVTRRRSPLG